LSQLYQLSDWWPPSFHDCCVFFLHESCIHQSRYFGTADYVLQYFACYPYIIIQFFVSMHILVIYVAVSFTWRHFVILLLLCCKYLVSSICCDWFGYILMESGSGFLCVMKSSEIYTLFYPCDTMLAWVLTMALSVCHKSVLYKRNGQIDLVFWHGGFFDQF